MKRICFGTIFTLLCQIKNCKNQNTLYSLLVTPSDTSDIEPDKGSVGNRKKGVDDIPGTEKNYFDSTDATEIAAIYRVNLAKNLKKSPYRESFVVAIKHILKEDTNISDTDGIGDIGYTKTTIMENSTFDFFLLLANLMKYCATIANNGLEDSIKEINADYLSSLSSEAKTIDLIDAALTPSPTPLALSVDERGFNNVFTEINPDTYFLGLLNPHKVKLFKLRVNTKEFDKNGISNFIINNISHYVYSRTKIKNIESTENIHSISLRAIREIEKTPAFSNQTDTFCEIMLYSFLECSMHAPKILSGFELDETGKSNKYSSGIYLLPAGVISSNNQIVFGCTDAHDNLQSAIDDVLNQASEIKENRDDEVRLLDPSVLGTILEPSTATYIRNLILPSKSTDIESDDAFGLFLSYSINVPNKANLSNIEYRVALDKQMNEDIKAYLPYIKRKIEELGLAAYSFYLFILPLDDVTKDAKKIMSDSIGGGD